MVQALGLSSYTAAHPYSSRKLSAALTLACQLQICRQTLQQAATPAELARFSLQMKKPSAQKADIGGVAMGLNKTAEPESLCRHVAGSTIITMLHWRKWSCTWGWWCALLSFQEQLSFPFPQNFNSKPVWVLWHFKAALCLGMVFLTFEVKMVSHLA